MNTISFDVVKNWLLRCGDVYTAHRDELTALDLAIGDGDHGANMARGFAALPAKLNAVPPGDVGALFKTAAMTLISTVGGASGPLYGTFFLQAARGATQRQDLSLGELISCFDAGLAGIVNLGKAQSGDKTMVDALAPALEALHPKPGDTAGQALHRAVEAARQGAEATIPWVARKGRASYLGERSAGHKDPGAASSVLLLQTLEETLAA